MNTNTAPTLDQTVARMKQEILADVAQEVLPPMGAIKSFSNLHDFVDANEYGGFCEDALTDALIAHYGGLNADEGMPQGMLDYMNAAQNEIDAWLRSFSS